MSVISAAYNAIVSEIQTLLPSHLRLSNPNVVEKNPEPQLKLGWGIRLAGATNAQLELGCSASFERDIIIIITRKFYANELNTVGKADVEKLILEDQFLLLKEFEKEPQVNATTGVINFVFVSDNGIEFVFTGESGNFLKIESTYKLRYIETI